MFCANFELLINYIYHIKGTHDLFVSHYRMEPDKQYILEGVILLSVGVFGICANVGAIFYFRKQRLQKETFYRLMFALNATDLLFNISCVCVFSIPALSDCKGFMDEECYVSKQFWKCLIWLLPLSNIFRTGNIFFTLALSIERYFAICKPFLFQATNCTPKFITILIILFSILFNVPKFFEFEWIKETSIINGTTFIQEGISETNLRSNWYYATIYILWCDLVFHGLIPFISLIILNILVLKEMIIFKEKIKMVTGEARTRKRTMRRLSENRMIQVHMAKFNIFVVLVFIICYSLHFVPTMYMFGMWILGDTNEQPLLIWDIIEISRVMEVFNSSVTFVWFLFKYHLIEKIHCIWKQNQCLARYKRNTSTLDPDIVESNNSMNI